MKNILTMTVREIYAILLITLMLLFTLIYTSFALFEKSVEMTGIASIVASDITFTITSSETSFITAGNRGEITVPAGETKTLDVTVKNEMSNSARYKVYYRFSNDITILNVNVGLSRESTSLNSDLISSGEEKTLQIVIQNKSDQSVTIEIGFQGGYATNSIISLDPFKNEINSIEYKDPSGANEPVLAGGMIPVIYNEDDDTWEVADTNEKWYSYGEQVWANAVTVTSENRATYMSSIPGTPIPMEDINSMWVWIPRYKYKIPSDINSNETVTLPPQIDVVFESGTNTTGVSESIYRTGISADGTNTNYYTHPSFRDGTSVYNATTYDIGGWDEELTGFWVSKFLMDGMTPNTPLLFDEYPTLFQTALNISGGIFDSSTGEITFSANENNIYGLNTINTDTNTHMMKNTEWGAVAILSQSQYGKMGNANYTGANKEVYYNDSNLTGRSSGVTSGTGTSNNLKGTYSYNDNMCLGDSNECVGEKVLYAGTGASTTGTIYGIYDMNKPYIIVMGNYNNSQPMLGGDTFLTFPPQKYYDLYKDNENPYITGDATWETKNWYSDTYKLLSSSNPWIIRNDGMFGVNDDISSGVGENSFAVLIP